MERTRFPADRRLVLVTGAGASVRLGDHGPMLLMADWSNTLVDALNDSEPGTSSALHLEKGASGEEFEAVIGDFLTWIRLLPLMGRVELLGRSSDVNVMNYFRRWHHHAADRVPNIVQVINTDTMG